MSSSIYGRLALTNLRNNRKTYLLTEEGRRVLEEEFQRLQRQVADGARILGREDRHERP